MTEGYSVGQRFEVTILDDKGEIVVHEFCGALTATNEEIEEMVFLIENGCPANLAAILARQHPDEIVDDPPMSGVEKRML
jgi:hypothetical protein